MDTEQRNQSHRMQFSLRAMLATIGALAVAFGFLAAAFSFPNNALDLLIAASIIASVIGTTLGPVLRIDDPARRRLLAAGCAMAAALICSFFVIGFEWSGDHPWPASDALYVISAIVRCGLLGCVVGYVVSVTLILAAGYDGDQNTTTAVPVAEANGWSQRLVPHACSSVQLLRSRSRVKTLVSAGSVIAVLILLWWPVWPSYQQERAIGELLAAIEAGRADEIPKRVLSVKRFDCESDAIGVVAFRAIHGRDERVRMSALQALKMLGKAAEEAPVLKPMLKEMLRDESEDVRAAAAEWLKAIEPPAAALGGQ